MKGNRLTRAACVAGCLAISSPLSADDDPSTAITAALEQWRIEFNEGRPDHICDLFSTDLLYDFQGLPEQNYEQLCDRLRLALSSPTRKFRYDLTVKEVIVSGDLAVARIVWHSTMTDGAKSEKEDQPGIDVFRRQRDGTWKIIRYVAYPTPP